VPWLAKTAAPGRIQQAVANPRDLRPFHHVVDAHDMRPAEKAGRLLGYGAKLKASDKKLGIWEWLPGRPEPELSKDLQGIGGTHHQSPAQFGVSVS